MPLNSATSRAGRDLQVQVAARAVSVRARVDDDHVARLRASSMRWNRIGCAHAVLEPAMKMHSAASMSS